MWFDWCILYRKQQGYILILLLFTIMLAGLEMLILTGGSNTILFQSNSVYLLAVEQNLVLSGLAWSKKNAEIQQQQNFGNSIKLDITDINVERAVLDIVINKPENNGIDVQIISSVGRGRQNLRHKKNFRLEYKSAKQG